MNKHIELVKKWLDNPDSVTAKELRDNADSASAAADFASAYDADSAVTLAADAAAYDAAYAKLNAADWVKRYEELTGE